MMVPAIRNWWYLVLRGALSILFGLAALTFPWQVITALVLLFGAYALVDGLIAVAYAIRVSHKTRVFTLLFEGALGVLTGVLTFLWPHITARLLMYLIAAWAIITGVLEIAAMAWLRRVGLSGLLLALSGVLSVAFGVTLFFAPQAGVVALAWMLGGYALFFGVLLCWLGLHFRRLYLVHGEDGDPSPTRAESDRRTAS